MKIVGSMKTCLLLVAILGVASLVGCSLPSGDTTAPTVLSVTPTIAATDAAINGTITATFSEAMDPTTFTTATFTLRHGTTPVTGTVGGDGTTVTFTPAGNLAGSTVYTATITTGVRDRAGNPLAALYAWTFTTGAIPDTTAPSVSSMVPAMSATGVAVNATISATFSEAMNSLSITTATFTLVQGTTPVTGTVAYAGVTAIFTPAGSLAPSTVYTATVTTGVHDLAGNAMAASMLCTFTTGTAPDTTPPTVSSPVPLNAAIDVAINGDITATFSEALAPLSVNTVTFTLKQGAAAITGTVAYAGTTATFNPASNLAYNTVYTATISTGAKDLAGNALASAYVWTFTTGALPDTTPPAVSATVPLDEATGVAINANISAIFSEAMDPLSVTTSTFTLKHGANSVICIVACTGTTATFTPAGALAYSTVYTATITTGAKDLAGNALAVNKVWSFTTGIAPDTTAPTVISTIPANAAANVATNATASATFSEAMDPLSVTTATFTLKHGATPVTGSVAYAGTTAAFTPTSTMIGSTLYTATITAGAKDLAGNAMASSKVWSFTTADTTPPTVISTLPANAAANVAINATTSATFSETMDPLSVTTATFTLKQGAAPVAGSVAYSGTTAAFTPASALTGSTLYTATITTGAKDLAGNAMASSKVWSFTTADTTPPTVISTLPANAAANVAINATASATFSEAMDPLTVTTASFTVKNGATPVAGSVAYSGTTATFTPASALVRGDTYTATITTGAKDLAGNAMASSKVWSFTTVPPLGPTAVNLATAGNYVILAKTAISNSSTSAIVGNVGLSPAAESAITGFALTDLVGYATTPEVTGNVYAADMVGASTTANLTAAVLDMEAAYTDAAGRLTPDHIDLGASGNIGGLTMPPGLYKWGTAVTMLSNVTISGGANDVWIFQVAGALTESSSVTVVLSGGAQAKNIFWQVAGAVTLEASSHFEGIILGKTAITLNTGATMNGRALAQSAVTLYQVTLMKPAP